MIKSLVFPNQIPPQPRTLYDIINSDLLPPSASEVLERLTNELTSMTFLGYSIGDKIQEITKNLPPETATRIRNLIKQKILNALRSVEESFVRI